MAEIIYHRKFNTKLFEAIDSFCSASFRKVKLRYRIKYIRVFPMFGLPDARMLNDFLENTPRASGNDGGVTADCKSVPSG